MLEDEKIYREHFHFLSFEGFLWSFYAEKTFEIGDGKKPEDPYYQGLNV